MLIRLCSLLLILLCPISSWAAVGFGAVASGNGSNTANVNVSYPTGIVAGNLLVLCVVNKYPANAPSTPTDFTAPTNNQGTGGAGAQGADSGTIYATIFVKEATGSESGSLAVSVPSANVIYATIARYTKNSDLWAYAAANGGDNLSGTTWSVTAGTDPGVQTGDVVVTCTGTNSDVSLFSAHAMSQTGITYGTASERFDNGTSFGDDVGMKLSDHVVTSGTSSGVPTYTATVSAANAGGTAFLRLREAVAGGAAARNLMLLGVGP